LGLEKEEASLYNYGKERMNGGAGFWLFLNVPWKI
jgi:hypothetical protein